jgi:hypothetical protein
MKAIKMHLILMALVLSGATGILPAQDSLRVAPFHLSFITPLGTNGMQSWNKVNRISLNLFAGYSGGLKGIEMAGFANALRGDMNGIQMAGFCNNTFGQAKGLELAGFWNYNQKKISGLQLSGFANVALDSVDGIQGSGYANVAVGDVRGVQSAGFANITVGDTRGVQAAGFANVTTGTQKGLQASGFVNYTRRLDGVQLGFINIADTVEGGIPIGFLSLVRHGYKVIQIGGNETFYGEVTFKTGVRRFYNIFSVGAAAVKGTPRWGFGYGLGTLFPVGKRFDLSLEGVSWQINDGEWYAGHMDLLNRLNLSLSYNFTRTIGVYAGAAFNVRVTGNEIDGEHPHHWTNEVTMYPGFNAGLRIGL